VIAWSAWEFLPNFKNKYSLSSVIMWIMDMVQKNVRKCGHRFATVQACCRQTTTDGMTVHECTE